MVFNGLQRFWAQGFRPPIASLCRPTAAAQIPLILSFEILEACIWRPGAWMSGCWQDWNTLEEVTEVMAFWGEGIGRNSPTLELRELGGFVCYCAHLCTAAPQCQLK